MRYSNQHRIKNSESIDWRMTDDGFLRCTARIQEEKILKYGADEMGDRPDNLMGQKEFNVFVPGESLANEESIKSLEGVPVVAWDHTWTDPSVVKEVSIGSVAGTPIFKDGFLVCDFLVTDAQAIQQIKNGDIGEISAAYYADTVFEKGDFKGESFDARQEALQYNHVAVIPKGEGRAGTDVRILNSKNDDEEDAEMSEIKLVRVQARNTKKILNMDEGSAEEYAEEKEEMEKKENAMNSEFSVHKEKAISEKKILNSRIEELEGELLVYKQREKEKGGDDKRIQDAAKSMMQDQDDAMDIMENVELVNTDGSPMDKATCNTYMNSLKKIHGSELRRTVLNASGLDVKDLSDAELKGAWTARKQISNMVAKEPAEPKVAGHTMTSANVKTVNAKPVARTAMERLGFPAKPVNKGAH